MLREKKRKGKKPVSDFENLDPAVQCNASLEVPDNSGAVTDCWHDTAVCYLLSSQLNSNCNGRGFCCQSQHLCESHPQEQGQLIVHQNIVQACQSSNPLLGIETSSLSCQSYKSFKDPVDEIQERLQLLSLNEMHGCSVSERQETSPFETKDKTVPGEECRDLVLYEGSFDPLKKRKIRPRVVLDSETIRVWNLLMGKRVIEANNTDDPEDKERHWEMERHIFKERAQNFIICMRQVQGDRQFSQWKGSVVDSVVGAFLTQNVSDHLSSSAFISLASRFPHIENTEVAPYDGKESERFMPKDAFCRTANEMISIGDEVNHEHCSTYYDVSHGVDCHNRALSYPKAGPLDGAKISVGFLDKYCVDYGEYNDSSESIIYDFLENFSQEGCHTGDVLPSEGEISIPADNQELEELKLNLTLKSTSEDCSTPDNLSLKVTKDEIKNKKIGHKKVSVSKISGIARANIEMGQGKSKNKFDWETISKNTNVEDCRLKRERDSNTKDAVNWDAVRFADLEDIADAIKERGMNNVLAGRIKRFLEMLHTDIGSIDLEWLKDIPPDDAKNFLLSIRGLGLKSVECIRLLTLQQLAFPVDTNVGRICVRLGWVPIEPLPESVQIHLLEQYPVLDSIQRYLWPRLCTLDQRTLYELHYQLITFGKVFCTKSRPNCNACPMRFQCKHFASACASAKPALPAPHDEFSSQQISSFNLPSQQNLDPLALPPNYSFSMPYQQNLDLLSNMLALEPIQQQHMTPDSSILQEFLPSNFQIQNYEPIIEEPATPEHEYVDSFETPALESPATEDDEIPTINLSYDDCEVQHNPYNSIQCSEGGDALTISRALVTVPPEAASIPVPKLKNIGRLRTEHRVYELPDSHQLLSELDPREPDDPCFYLLAIWSPDEMLEKGEETEPCCCTANTMDDSTCTNEICSSCTNMRDLNDKSIKGTLLIPCRTAMRGSFPLNGTYFQVNEVFADHETSLHPIEVPRNWIWNLRRRTVYFGTSIPSIFKGLTAEAIQACFWKGYVCVRGFERKVRAPRPLTARLHFPASKREKSQKKTAA